MYFLNHFTTDDGLHVWVEHKHVKLLQYTAGMRDGISTGWLDLFMRYINHTFPHQNHIAINAARAATAPAEYANSMCLHSMIPKQTDIVIIGIYTLGVS